MKKLSKDTNLNVTTPQTGRGISGNLAVTGKLIKRAEQSGVSKIRGSK